MQRREEPKSECQIKKKKKKQLIPCVGQVKNNKVHGRKQQTVQKRKKKKTPRK